MHNIFKFAYLDPGTGSMIIQALIGIVAGVALFGRKAIQAVRSKLTGNISTADVKKAEK
jgi:hypothetical protein